MRRTSVWMALALAAGGGVRASADGGAPVASVRVGDAAWTLLVSPASPSVGPVEFTLLGPMDPAAVIRIWEPEGGPVQELRLQARNGIIGRVASASMDTPGECRFQVTMEGMDTPLVSGTLPVAPAAPPWQARLPWLLAWLPMAVVLALRARAQRARRLT